MIAVIGPEDEDPHVIKLVQQNFVSVKAETWCGETHKAGDGVRQILASSKLCAKCVAAIENHEKIAKLTGGAT